MAPTLGSRSGLLASALLAATTLAYYFSPTLTLAALTTLAFIALAWWRLDLALLAVIATAPFYRFPKLFDASFTGALATRDEPIEISLAEWALWACVAAWLLRFLHSPFPHPPFPRSLVPRSPFLPYAPALILIAIAALSLPFAEHRREALREFRVVILEPALYYLLLVSTLHSSTQVLRSLHFFVAAGAAIAAYALYHYIFIGIVEATGGVRRLLAVYHSPNALALFLGRLLPIAATLSLPRTFTRSPHIIPSSPHLLATAAHGSGFLLMLLALYLTFSRGAALGVAAALVFLGFMTSRRVTLIALAAVLVAAAAAAPFLPLDRIFQAAPVTQRLLLWQAAIDMATDHPLMGVGLDNFLYYYPQYMRPEAALEPDMSHPHNLFLDFWLRLGILGLAALAGLQWLFWRTAVRLLRRPITSGERGAILALMASMLDFVVHGLIDNSYFLIDLAFVFWFSFGLLTVMARAIEQGDRSDALA